MYKCNQYKPFAIFFDVFMNELHFVIAKSRQTFQNDQYNLNYSVCLRLNFKKIHINCW